MLSDCQLLYHSLAHPLNHSAHKSLSAIQSTSADSNCWEYGKNWTVTGLIWDVIAVRREGGAKKWASNGRKKVEHVPFEHSSYLEKYTFYVPRKKRNNFINSIIEKCYEATKNAKASKCACARTPLFTCVTQKKKNICWFEASCAVGRNLWTWQPGETLARKRDKEITRNGDFFL